MRHPLRSNSRVNGIKIMTLESVLAVVRTLPGVLSVDLYGKSGMTRTTYTKEKS